MCTSTVSMNLERRGRRQASRNDIGIPITHQVGKATCSKPEVPPVLLLCGVEVTSSSLGSLSLHHCHAPLQNHPISLALLEMISQLEVKEGHCPSPHSLSQERQLALHTGKSLAVPGTASQELSKAPEIKDLPLLQDSGICTNPGISGQGQGMSHRLELPCSRALTKASLGD